MRGKHGRHARGCGHYRWNAGKIISGQGYSKVRVGRDHPLADPNGYAYEHLLAWVAAGHPRPGGGEVIHHKNGDKQDNRLGNLELVTRSDHNRRHNVKRRRGSNGRFLDGKLWDEYPEAK